MVVEVFISECKTILYKKLYVKGKFFDESIDLDPNDLAMDFIAPSFARDEEGTFVILRDFFQPCLSYQPEEFQTVFYQFLNTIVKKELIRYFQEKDPFGKIFYRSLKYILSKHPEWEKSMNRSLEESISVYGRKLPIADEPDISLALLVSENKILTCRIEKCLEVLLTEKQVSVRISDLLKAVRELGMEDTWFGNFSQDIDQPVQMTVSMAISHTVMKIDKLILSKYERENKITPAERKGCREALRELLKEQIQFGSTEKLYDYFIRHVNPDLPNLEYRQQYRQQFEYIVRKSRKIFSAVLKNDSNNINKNGK